MRSIHQQHSKNGGVGVVMPLPAQQGEKSGGELPFCTQFRCELQQDN